MKIKSFKKQGPPNLWEKGTIKYIFYKVMYECKYIEKSLKDICKMNLKVIVTFEEEVKETGFGVVGKKDFSVTFWI